MLLRSLLLVAAAQAPAERVPMLLFAPSASDVVFEATRRVLGEHTKLELIPREHAGVSFEEMTRCEERERLRCWSRASTARYLAVMSVTPAAPSELEVSILFVDVDSARAIEKSAAPEAAEDRIWQESTRHTEKTLPVNDDGAIAAFVERAIFEHLEPMLEKNGHWGPPQRIQAAIPQPPAPPPPPEEHPPIVFYGGLGVAAVGLVLTIAAVARSPRAQSIEVCEMPPCGAEVQTFSNFCEVFASRPGECGSGGVLVAPLGIGLALAGGTWSIGASTFEEDSTEWPWWSLVSGAILGALAYTISAAAQ